MVYAFDMQGGGNSATLDGNTLPAAAVHVSLAALTRGGQCNGSSGALALHVQDGPDGVCLYLRCLDRYSIPLWVHIFIIQGCAHGA